jgi:hypothetical protein
VAAAKNIRNVAGNSAPGRNKIQELPFTSVKPSAYNKFTYTTDAVVSKSLGFYIGCKNNEQL